MSYLEWKCQTSVGKAVDFLRLALAVPIRLQNETTCARHFVHSAKYWQLENELVSVDYASKVGEKQFSEVQKRRKSEESKIKVCCNWFAGLTRSPYCAAPSLHVQSASQDSTQLWMPRR